MLQMKYVINHLDEIKNSLELRHNNFPIDELLGLYKSSNDIKKRLQLLSQQRNKGGAEISKTPQNEKIIIKLKEIKEQIKILEEQSSSYEERINLLLLRLPNLLDPSVPNGMTYEDSKELKVVGKINNKRLENFESLLANANLIDTTTASELTGKRFYFLKNDFVLLEHAIMTYSLDFLSKRGFSILDPPLMLRKKYYDKVVDIEKYKNILYKVISEQQDKKDNDTYMVASSEHITAATQTDKLISTNSLPIKNASISTCFRNEPQTKGKDLAGLFKVHQFNQIDQFVFCKENESNTIFDELQKNEEDFVQSLDLPYKIFAVSSGDLSIKATKALDLKVYVPSEGAYKEYGYCANLTDWQSMRLNTRYEDHGERKYVHTVACTLASFPRILLYLFQNNLIDNNFIEIPKPLISYMGKSKIML